MLLSKVKHLRWIIVKEVNECFTNDFHYVLFSKKNKSMLKLPT